MFDVPLIGQKPKVVTLTPRNKITEDSVKNWTCAVDLLKALIVDIEHGRISEPEVIYVSMLTRNKKNPELVAKPSYSWATPQLTHNRLVVAGLLEHHKLSILGV